MDGINDYLKRKADQLGLERGEQLAEIQEYLDELYPGQCRAVSLHDGVLRVGAQSASMASELRFNQRKVTERFPVVSRITVVVGHR